MNLDYFKKDASELKDKKLFLFDMDGTIYSEETLFDGTIDLINAIKDNDGNYVFITNNSSKGIDDYLKKINGFGIEANENNFFTSIDATVLLFDEVFRSKKIYVQGTKSMVKELKDRGLNITLEVEDDIDCALLGFDTEFTYEKAKKTITILNRGIPYYATNCDLRCPVNFGYIPDCGSIAMMYENCTGRKPIYIGKPEKVMAEMAIKKYNCDKSKTVIIGDRLYTDIMTGVNAGITSICVLSGEATVNDIEKGNIKPTYTFNSVKEIYEILKNR